eukprot:scaffold259_cov252-Pinguiococcus_pyrenoidosus.AAC.32
MAPPCSLGSRRALRCVRLGPCAATLAPQGHQLCRREADSFAERQRHLEAAAPGGGGDGSRRGDARTETRLCDAAAEVDADAQALGSQSGLCRGREVGWLGLAPPAASLALVVTGRRQGCEQAVLAGAQIKRKTPPRRREFIKHFRFLSHARKDFSSNLYSELESGAEIDA